MRRIKKLMAAVLLLCMTMCFAGCGEEKLVSEDFNRTNIGNGVINPIMKTDTGYYYNQSSFNELSLHYYDVANGKNMYLCNKPECRHEGDEFCAATSDKYRVMDTVLYGGSLYISALEKTETAYEYKLLKAALDGSSLSEVITYFVIDNVSLATGGGGEMVIHRNKAFLPYFLVNPKNTEVGIGGVAIYDMESGELTYLGEKEGSIETKRERFEAYGDYMYFVQTQKYKKELMRYSYADGSVEKMELKTGFRGGYTVYDENTIFYIRGDGSEIHIFRSDTKENTQIDIEEWFGFFTEGEDGAQELQCYVSLDSMISDGEYVYIPENISFDRYSCPYQIYHSEGEPDTEYAEITILDKDGNYVNHVEVSSKKLLGYNEFFSLHFVEDAVYMQTPTMVYECSKADFIAGNADFKECYPLDINIRSAKELE